MVRDVLRRAIDKGQLPGAVLGLVVIIVALRLPPADLSKLVFLLLDLAVAAPLLGWGIALVLLLGAAGTLRMTRGTYEREIRRISQAKSDVQKQLLPDGSAGSSARK